MANEYAVNQADLKAVADVIRQKGGTSEPLAFPGGFVGAIAAIQAGGGSGSGVEIGSNNFPGSISDMLNAIVSGTAKVGSFQLAKILSNTERELVFDTGLDDFSNLALINDGYPKNYMTNYAGYGFVVWDGKYETNENNAGFGGMTFVGRTQGWIDVGTNNTGGTSRGYLFKEGGKVFGVTENNWNNVIYTCLTPNVKYWWVAW